MTLLPDGPPHTGVTLQNNITDVVGLGLNAMDTICVVPRFPQPNTKTHMNAVRTEPGGRQGFSDLPAPVPGWST